MGPCTVNARRPTVDSRCRGTTIICCVADLRCCLPTSVTGVQQSTRYCTALSCRHLRMMTPSLYVTWSATLSQYKSSCKIWVRPWSNFRFIDDACGSVHNTLQGVSDSLRDIWLIIYLGFEKSQHGVMHDSLRYINILTYLLTYLLRACGKYGTALNPLGRSWMRELV